MTTTGLQLPTDTILTHLVSFWSQPLQSSPNKGVLKLWHCISGEVNHKNLDLSTHNRVQTWALNQEWIECAEGKLQLHLKIHPYVWIIPSVMQATSKFNTLSSFQAFPLGGEGGPGGLELLSPPSNLNLSFLTLK